MYLITGAGEELGWSAIATPPMVSRWGTIRAGFLLGIIWAFWHSIAFAQTGSPFEWVAWQSIKTIAMRIIIVWLYIKPGTSIFAVVIYHATDNVSWSLFPNISSYYDPAVTGPLNWVVAFIIIFVGALNSTPGNRSQE
jgi:uncharacterized protein